MTASEHMTFSNLKSNVSDSIKQSCLDSDALIHKIANAVHEIPTHSVEPGVEIAQGLSTIIDATIQKTVRSGCDITAVIKGILVGAFRSNRSVRSEAHKTIHLLAKEITDAIFKYAGDPKQFIQGFLAAIVMVAQEQKLNVEETLQIACEDLISSAQEHPGFAERIRSIIPKEYAGWQITN